MGHGTVCTFSQIPPAAEAELVTQGCDPPLLGEMYLFYTQCATRYLSHGLDNRQPKRKDHVDDAITRGSIAHSAGNRAVYKGQ